ncbi:MAG: transposase, partial [Clostridiales bacterium]|nr:transposase [Clostridiales bacterium]
MVYSNGNIKSMTFRSEFQKTTEMKKDTIYRLKNNERFPWRRLLYGVAKKFQELVNPQKEVAANSAFIVDDTIDERVGYKIENITTVHDHVAGKKGSKYGFKNLVLVFFDGKSISPLDFSIHTEKALPKKKQKKQFKKECTKISNGFKRRAERKKDKITGAL